MGTHLRLFVCMFQKDEFFGCKMFGIGGGKEISYRDACQGAMTLV